MVGLAASPLLKMIVESIRDRAVARGRIRSECDRAKAWAWALLEHVHELRVMLIRSGVPEDDLPEIPQSPSEDNRR